jgi:hypothetical protein
LPLRGALPLRERVAQALVNKGSRSEKAVAVYYDLLARFGTATELPLRGLIVDALSNRVARGLLARSGICPAPLSPVVKSGPLPFASPDVRAHASPSRHVAFRQ